MRNLLIYNVLAAILFIYSSCSSDNEANGITSTERAKHKVTMQVAGIDTQYLKSLSTATLTVKHLEYWVLSESNQIVLHQSLGADEVNNEITFDIESGNYTIIFYAADQELEHNENTNPRNIVVPNMTAQLFSGKSSFSVDEADVIVDEAIILKRAVGRIEIVIEDLENLPAEVKSITPIFGGAYIFTGNPSFPTAPWLLDITGNWTNEYITSSEMYKELTIPRESFASINENNPIVFYTINTTVGSAFGRIHPTDLYILGSKTEAPDRFTNNTEPDSDTYFLRVVKRDFSIAENQSIRYTGKIGNINDNSWQFDVDDTWKEVEMEIASED